jgi:hypothetical protein
MRFHTHRIEKEHGGVSRATVTSTDTSAYYTWLYHRYLQT